MTAQTAIANPFDALSCDRPLVWGPSLAFLKFAIGAMFAGALTFEAALFIFAPEQTARALSVLYLVSVAAVAWIFVARGRAGAAVVTLLVGVWTYVTLSSLFLGGVASTTIIIYPLLILLAGWLLSARAATVVAVLTVLVTMAFVLAEAAGLLPAAWPTPPVMRWITQAGVFVISTVLITYVVRSYRNRLDEVRTLGIELAARTAELQASEADLRRAQAVARIGSWVHDIAGNRVRMSAETCRVLGLPEHTIGSYEGYLARVHPADRVAVGDAWQHALSGSVAFDNEHRILVGGEVRWVRQIAQVERAAAGVALRAIGTIQDITARKAMEDALRESEGRLCAILGATADGILAVDCEGRVLLTNRRFAELWRVPQALLDGGDDQALLDFVVSQLLEPEAFIRKVQALYQSDVESHDTICFRDGRVFARYIAPLMRNNVLVGRVWSFRNVTERLRAQRNLELAVEVTGVLLWELDVPSSRFRYDFDMLEKLGVEAGDAPESFQVWCDRVHPQERAAFEQRVALALQPGDRAFDMEYRLSSRAGEYQWMHSKGQVVQRDASGAPLLAVGTTTNVTARKQAEAALAGLNAELERRVAQRTAELEAANVEFNSFSYAIAHDMRAPVRAINGFSERVLQSSAEKLDPVAVGDLRRVIAASRHMGELIDDLLNLARLSRQALRVQEIDLHATAAAAVAALAESQPARAVMVNIEPGMKTRADPGLLRALLDNLIGNAWKFTGKSDAPCIGVGRQRRDGVTCYYVRDNGAGFDMQYAHKLFAPFQRLHHADEFEGTGIGLAAVRKIVERHGGRVWIESNPGAGTTVYFTRG